jgi:hypothetical protein
MKELLNIPKTFQETHPYKLHTSTEWSGNPSSIVEGLKKPSTIWTNNLGPSNQKEKRSIDELW